jgi:hypothetical protein
LIQSSRTKMDVIAFIINELIVDSNIVFK